MTTQVLLKADGTVRMTHTGNGGGTLAPIDPGEVVLELPDDLTDRKALEEARKNAGKAAKHFDTAVQALQYPKATDIVLSELPPPPHVTVMPSGELPKADVDHIGVMMCLEGPPDTVHICLQRADKSFAWVQIASG